MRYPVSVPGMEGRRVEIVTPQFSGSVQALVDGTPAPVGKQRGEFLVPRPNGQVAVIQLKAGFPLDGAVRVTVDGLPQTLGTPRPPLEIALIWSPIFLVFVGGLIGGLCAGIAVALNLALFQSKSANGLKYSGALATTAGAFGLFFAGEVAQYRFTHPAAVNPQSRNGAGVGESKLGGGLSVGAGDLALGSKGAKASSDSELASEAGCTPKVNDGIIAASGDFSNRWHSSIETPHPHWVQITLPRPAKVGRVTVYFADPQGYAVSFEGVAIRNGQRVILFDVKNYRTSQPCTRRIAPATLDAFRLIIRKSANPLYPNAAQVSEIALYPPANR